MLNFLNKKIYLDFEIFNSYTNDSLLFCSNPYTTNRKDNEIYYKDIKVSELKKMDSVEHIHMNFGQFKGFIKEWLKNVYLTVDIDSLKWCVDYYNCIKEMSDIVGDTLDYTSYNSIFRKRQKWFIDNLDVNCTELPSPIIFDEPVKPELSWVIADVLNCMCMNVLSLYKEQFEENLQINISKCNEYKNRSNIFSVDYINFNEYSNCSNINDICYLYFPLSGEMVYSNFVYIEKCLKDYLEKKC